MFKVQKGLITQKIDDQILIFDPEKSTLYALNETAYEIFQQLKKGQKRKIIIENILKKYQVKKEKLEKDYNKLINDLLKKGIIKKL